MSESTESELERVYRESAVRIWRALLASTRSAEVASDALHEAFAQAAARGDGIVALDRWVWKAAFRIAAGDMKERRLTVSSPMNIVVSASEDAMVLMDALARLPQQQRSSLVLHYYGGYKAREIAEVIGCSAATARVHLSAGRRRLRRLLEEDDDA